ncbi:hypothetical protein ACFTWS_34365 [Streptomyces sp. NPDC057027]|uniref:hypothetical protein n=1 Tax=Streptomyces sp. NPDC057027 TaxID=3346004 RepID=UPI003635ACA6
MNARTDDRYDAALLDAAGVEVAAGEVAGLAVEGDRPRRSATSCRSWIRRRRRPVGRPDE